MEAYEGEQGEGHSELEDSDTESESMLGSDHTWRGSVCEVGCALHPDACARPERQTLLQHAYSIPLPAALKLDISVVSTPLVTLCSSS